MNNEGTGCACDGLAIDVPFILLKECINMKVLQCDHVSKLISKPIRIVSSVNLPLTSAQFNIGISYTCVCALKCRYCNLKKWIYFCISQM